MTGTEGGIRSLLDHARRSLADAPREALGELIVPRRVLGFARAPRIARSGAAWHLGVLLLADDAVFATGDVVRARHEAHRGFTSEAQRHRADLAAAAARGGFTEGETVHLDWRRLDLDEVQAGAASGPLALRGGAPAVRWSAAAGYVPLAGYLAERVELLRNPPAGA